MNRLIALVLVATISSWAAKKPKAKPEPPQPIAMHDEVVETGNGVFTFTRMALTPNILPYLGLSGYKLNGVVRNDSGHAWRAASFKIRFLDSSGNSILLAEVPLSYVGVKQGIAAPMTLIPDYHVNFFDTPPSGGFQIVFEYGELDVAYKYRMTKPLDTDSLSFEDADILTAFVIQDSGITPAVLNKTNDPVKIDWNQVSIVDIFNASHGVTHEGVKYADAAASKPPTIIPPSAKMTDTVIPADNVHFTSGQYGGWSTAHLIPRGTDPGAAKSKTLGLFMPLEIKGVTKNYLFQFQITDVIY